MHSENFKADFLKMQPSKTRHIHIFFLYRVETWFKYQNNQQNLQIWDIPQIAKFKLRLIYQLSPAWLV